MSVSVQVVSDLHLDLNRVSKPSDVITPSSEYLICAGDIAEIRSEKFPEFLMWASKNFRRVFFVPGNHEFYGMSLWKGRKRLHDLVKHLPNVVIMECTEATLSSTWKILGCTLWSELGEKHDDSWTYGFSDFHQIDGMTPSIYRSLHSNDLKWLTSRLQNKQPGEKLLVVTHHAPLTRGTSAPQYENSPDRLTNRFFSTDLSRLVNMADAWIYGHTHFTRHETTPFSNPLGYVEDDECPDYDPEFALVLR